jgi:hypothetical protein
MTFSNYLKGQLTDIVDNYRKYFWRTLGTALTYTVLCFVVTAMLLKFSVFDETGGRYRQISLLSYLFSRFSYNFTYSLVDLSKSVFLFFVSLFSLGLLRQEKTGEDQELFFGSFTKKLNLRDILALSGTLILCSATDFGLFRLEIMSSEIKNFGIQKFYHSFIFLLRIYVPLLLFSLSIYKLTSHHKLNLNLKKILFLFVSLWLVNEFAYEFFIFTRGHLFSFLLAPFDESKIFTHESILAIPLMAFFFIVYHSAMTTSLKQLDEQ